MPREERIILSEEISDKLNSCLKDFINLSLTKAAFIITKGGQLLNHRGIPKKGDKLFSIVSLISGIFSSTQKLAILIGDTGFRSFFQGGKKYSIYYSLFFEPFVFVTIFDENALLGDVQLRVEELEENIKKMLIMTIKGETERTFFTFTSRTSEEAFTDLFDFNI